MEKTLKFRVVGDNKMNCGGCERSVVGTLRALPGIAEVRADRTTQNIEVDLASDETAAEAIRTELGEIGYEVEPV